MNSLSENEKAACRERLATLNQYIAPTHLPEHMRLCIFQQVKTLLSQLPSDFWCHFELLTSLEQNLTQQTQKGITNRYDARARDVYLYIHRRELVTTHACAAAICAPTSQLKTADVLEKHIKYQSLTILSCLQLHIMGQHESAIENALREIRLIATTSEHQQLLTYLPPLDSNSSSDELITALKQLRELDKIPSGRLRRGLSFLYVVINDACRMAKGVTRHREESNSYTPIVEEKLELTKQASTDDTDQIVSELKILRLHANPEFDESDEPLDVRPGKVICVHEPSSPYTTQALRALQSKRLAEQLAIRQQSLPCSFEQASEWDIQHLVAETVTRLSDTASQKPAALLLLSLLSGRYPEQLIHRNESTKPLQEFKQHPCLFISHSVPASKQHPSCDAILPKVREHLILPLPTVLKGQIITSLSADAETLNAIIRSINERHQTRLTLGRITRYLEHWYLNQGLDRAEVALIRGEQLKSRAALSYSNLNVDKILQHHHDYIDFLFKTAGLDPKLPPLHPTDNRLGSRLALPRHVLHNLFALLSPTQAPNRSSTLDDILVYHNQYISYVWLLLVFVTGHRDVTAPMGLISDYNPHNRTWWISDKEIRHGLAARTVVLPLTAARQVELYKEHLRALAKRTRFVAPTICKRCGSALSGSDNLLFAIMTPIGEEATPADLCPSLLQSMLGDKIPWARNWPRHHLRSELIREGVSPEQIDGWMGHEEIGEEALGRHSAFSLRFLEHIADKIENILNAHKIEARSGWQTR